MNLSVSAAWRDRACVAGIAIAGLALRSWHLDARSMWFDEAVAWRTAAMPVSAGVRAVAEDVHMPAYFLLLKAWMTAFGESLSALRFFSVVWGVAAIAGMWALATEALPPPRRRLAGALGAALIAGSWFHVHYSAEVRMYSMMSALGLWSSVALLRAIDGRGLLAYVALAVLLTFSHPLALFFVAAQALFWLLADRGRPSLVRFATAYGAIAAAFAPWLAILLRQSGRVAAEGWMDRPSISRVALSFDDALFHGDAFPRSFLRMWIGAAVSTAILVGLVANRSRSRGETLAAFTVPATVLLAFAASLALDESLFTSRYVVIPQTMLMFAAAALVTRIPESVVRRTAAVALVVVTGTITMQVSRALDVQKRPGTRAAAEWLASRRKPGDLVVTSGPLLHLPFQYYSRDARLYSDGGANQYYFANSVIAGEERIRPHDLVDARGRAWVINTTGDWSNWKVPLPPDWEAGETRSFPEVFLFQGDVTVTEYRIRPASPAGAGEAPTD